MLFAFRDSGVQGTGFYNLSNRTSLAMSQAQLSVGQYTFPANRYLLYDCGTAISNTAVGTTSYYGYANQVNFWMSAMKFFGLGIDRQSGCSTNRTQFNQWYNPVVEVVNKVE